ncbi:hypothetical protein MSG28_009942 [Choristoneura fumiferana]|uniref:Uncharacterized protein n=1 Tax=Choristoneura fumiferana TaxID=7141 RepID=A0ACC0JD59_CHOFU|nr:hypothetical protein MSG28_009942 [Choristoneura fumiferana]
MRSKAVYVERVQSERFGADRHIKLGQEFLANRCVVTRASGAAGRGEAAVFSSNQLPVQQDRRGAGMWRRRGRRLSCSTLGAARSRNRE